MEAEIAESFIKLFKLLFVARDFKDCDEEKLGLVRTNAKELLDMFSPSTEGKVEELPSRIGYEDKEEQFIKDYKINCDLCGVMVGRASLKRHKESKKCAILSVKIKQAEIDEFKD